MESKKGQKEGQQEQEKEEEGEVRFATPTLYQEADDSICACITKACLVNGVRHISVQKCQNHKRLHQKEKLCGCLYLKQKNKWQRNAYCEKHMEKYFKQLEHLSHVREKIKHLKGKEKKMEEWIEK